ncbi:MAG: hypothetical protein GY754_14310 [bacterium]|nr:hypothetical protein [bacterium]
MRLTFIFLLLTIVSVISSCSNEYVSAPTAKNGVLDLRGWDFKKDGPVKLSGKWEFYWEQFLVHEDLI